ncbi:MAG: MBL fold metallo-hydrolase [Candidatus Bilamarchaeaceae archaeon]
MITLDCLGAAGEVGRSAFLLKTDKRLLLDYGVKIFDISGKPRFPSEDVEVDAMLLSHAHLDHSGFVPALYKRNQKIRWFATPPTEEICELLWYDSMKIMGENLPYSQQHFKKALSNWSPMLYGQPLQFGETEVMLNDAGHIAGAGIISIEYNNKKIVYTGDFKLEDTRMHKGAKTIKGADVLIIESTYADREHPNRKEIELEIIKQIEETVEEGGSALFPAFSLGRTQELIALIRHYNREVPIFVDGMGKDITQIYLRYGNYIKDIGAFRKAVNSVVMIERRDQKAEATRTPGVIIASAGMLMGGPMVNYLFNANNKSRIIFTGYNVEGSNGWSLLNKGTIIVDGQELAVDLPAQYLDLSAHAGRSDLLKFINDASPEKIILVHGDKPDLFAAELQAAGYDAVAPKIGEKISI